MGSRVVLLLGPPLSEVIAVVLSGKEEVFQLTLGLKTSRLLSALSFYDCRHRTTSEFANHILALPNKAQPREKARTSAT